MIPRHIRLEDLEVLLQVQPFGLWVPELKKEIDRLGVLIAQKEDALRDAPEGRLEFGGGASQRAYRRDDTGKHYLGKDQTPLIEALAQKSYDDKVLKEAQALLRSLEKIYAKPELGQLPDIYSRLTEVRQKLVDPDYLSDELFREYWEAIEYDGKSFP